LPELDEPPELPDSLSLDPEPAPPEAGELTDGEEFDGYVVTGGVDVG
jgi:hypothetical protein